MAYLTIADLVAKLGESELNNLADKNSTGDGTEINARVIQAINFATGKIDGYVRHRYVIPLTSNDETKQLAIPLALYNLYSDAMEVPDGKYKIIKDSYDSVVKFLEAVAASKVNLDQTMLSTVYTGISADVPLVVVDSEDEERERLFQDRSFGWPWFGCERFR